jgi:hypothetical protein
LNVRIPEEKQTSHPWKFYLFAIFKMLSAALFLRRGKSSKRTFAGLCPLSCLPCKFLLFKLYFLDKMSKSEWGGEGGHCACAAPLAREIPTPDWRCGEEGTKGVARATTRRPSSPHHGTVAYFPLLRLGPGISRPEYLSTCIRND